MLTTTMTNGYNTKNGLMPNNSSIRSPRVVQFKSYPKPMGRRPEVGYSDELHESPDGDKWPTSLPNLNKKGYLQTFRDKKPRTEIDPSYHQVLPRLEMNQTPVSFPKRLPNVVDNRFNANAKGRESRLYENDRRLGVLKASKSFRTGDDPKDVYVMKKNVTSIISKGPVNAPTPRRSDFVRPQIANDYNFTNHDYSSDADVNSNKNNDDDDDDDDDDEYIYLFRSNDDRGAVANANSKTFPDINKAARVSKPTPAVRAPRVQLPNPTTKNATESKFNKNIADREIVNLRKQIKVLRDENVYMYQKLKMIEQNLTEHSNLASEAGTSPLSPQVIRLPSFDENLEELPNSPEPVKHSQNDHLDVDRVQKPVISPIRPLSRQVPSSTYIYTEHTPLTTERSGLNSIEPAGRRNESPRRSEMTSSRLSPYKASTPRPSRTMYDQSSPIPFEDQKQQLLQQLREQQAQLDETNLKATGLVNGNYAYQRSNTYLNKHLYSTKYASDGLTSSTTSKKLLNDITNQKRNDKQKAIEKFYNDASNYQQIYH